MTESHGFRSLVSKSLFAIVACVLWMALVFQLRYYVPMTIHVLQRMGIETPELLRFIAVNITEVSVFIVAGSLIAIGVFTRRRSLLRSSLLLAPIAANIVVHCAIYQADWKLISVLQVSSLH